jgi:hypothetical protein
MKNKMTEEGYKFVKYLVSHVAVFEDINNGNKKEVWIANKGHASYGFSWHGTDWEFASDYNADWQKIG